MTEHERDPGALADELEEKTDELEGRSQELGDEISGVRADWASKRSDPGVPGAVPPSDAELVDSDDDSDERVDKTKTEDKAEGTDGS